MAAFAPRGELLHAPDVYMQKIAARPGLDLRADDLDRPLDEVLARLQGQAGRPLRVIMLDRERHRPMMAAVRAAGAALSLIPDGDVMGALLTALPGAVASSSPRFDLYVGSGGAPEGVLAAAGLQALGGSMFGRLIFRDDDERERAARIGLGPAEQGQIFALSDLASGHAHLVLAGVTGDVLDGATTAGAQVLSLAPACAGCSTAGSDCGSRSSRTDLTARLHQNDKQRAPERAPFACVFRVIGGPGFSPPVRLSEDVGVEAVRAAVGVDGGNLGDQLVTVALEEPWCGWQSPGPTWP